MSAVFALVAIKRNLGPWRHLQKLHYAPRSAPLLSLPWAGGHFHVVARDWNIATTTVLGRTTCSGKDDRAHSVHQEQPPRHHGMTGDGEYHKGKRLDQNKRRYSVLLVGAWLEWFG